MQEVLLTMLVFFNTASGNTPVLTRVADFKTQAECQQARNDLRSANRFPSHSAELACITIKSYTPTTK